MNSIAEGKAYVFGNNIDTDQIYPGKYVELTEMEDIKKYAMSGSEEPELAKVFQPGDIIVAEDNFGCGSSREHAPVVIKQRGISCVIANTFARIFYRNAINIGLPILECPEAGKAIKDGDEVSVDFGTGVIENLTTGETYQAAPFPEFIQEIIDKGGLLASIKEG